MEAPSEAQMEKRRPVCRRCADGGRLDLHGLLWHRGACAGHPDGSRRRAAGAFPTGFYSPADSDSRVLPRNARLPLYGHRGHEKLAYFSRLRKLLRAANDWTCDLPALARKAQIKQEKAYETVAKAVANGDLPNAAISDDYSTLYLDDSLMPTAAKPAAAPQAEPAEPLTDAEQFRREGMDFLNYLKVCRGKLGTDADEELAAMQKTCASIMGFVHNHPEQLNRVRRFREYYLPTTRKLLDTAQGLGDTDSANAAEIRRDITGILHTLNQAYEKLYDTLLQDVSMDVSTEIDTLEAMLRQDGLTHDFEADFNTRS